MIIFLKIKPVIFRYKDKQTDLHLFVFQTILFKFERVRECKQVYEQKNIVIFKFLILFEFILQTS